MPASLLVIAFFMRVLCYEAKKPDQSVALDNPTSPSEFTIQAANSVSMGVNRKGCKLNELKACPRT
jgi:hypothetical protein